MDAATVNVVTRTVSTMSHVETAIARIEPIVKVANERPAGHRFQSTSTHSNTNGRGAEIAILRPLRVE